MALVVVMHASSNASQEPQLAPSDHASFSASKFNFAIALQLQDVSGSIYGPPVWQGSEQPEHATLLLRSFFWATEIACCSAARWLQARTVGQTRTPISVNQTNSDVASTLFSMCASALRLRLLLSHGSARCLGSGSSSRCGATGAFVEPLAAVPASSQQRTGSAC